MLMVVESTLAAEVEFTPAAQPVGSERMMIEARLGETYHFAAGRCGVEIVLGFRPGIDRIVVAVESEAPRADRALTTEESGETVIIDGAGRRIIIQGIALNELVRGDIAIERSR
jgi:hypothetical protein